MQAATLLKKDSVTDIFQKALEVFRQASRIKVCSDGT